MKTSHEGTVIVVSLAAALLVFAFGLVFAPISDDRLVAAKDVLLLIVGGFLGYLTKHAVEASGENSTATMTTTETGTEESKE